MATFATLSADVAAVGGLDYTSESVTSDRWAKGGLRMINRSGAYEWLHAYTSFSWVADQYNYPFSTIASDLFRIDTKSIRFGGSDSFLSWGHINRIDDILGVSWKDGAGLGTPLYATRVGNSLWVATVPDAAFVSDYPSVFFYTSPTENYTGEIYLPEEFYDIAIDAALAFGFTQENDPRSREFQDRFRVTHIPAMFGAKMDIGNRDRLQTPEWMSVHSSRMDDYGDGEGK